MKIILEDKYTSFQGGCFEENNIHLNAEVLLYL